MFKGLMTGVSGVRGVIGEGMTPEVALLWSTGFASWLKGGKIVVGRDARPSGIMLNHAVRAGLSAAGCEVDDIGMVPTPTAALAVKKRGAAGGIIITASHNPQEWNALKFVRSDGRMLTAREAQELESIVEEGPLRSVSWDKLGFIRDWENAEYAYLTEVTGLSLLDLDRIHRKKFKVAIDAVNGAGSETYPQLLEMLGCEVIRIHCDGSGLFPRGPEPVPENLKQLSQTVRNEGCAIGFAVDPDGDRLAIVDERGNPAGEEMTLAFAIQTVLQQKPGPVVVNVLTTQTVDDVADEFGVLCHRTKVGEANVAARIKEIGAVIGGEGNGGIILPELHMVRDAGVGMALLLNRLSSTRKTTGELVAALPVYKMKKTAVSVGSSDPIEIIEDVASLYAHDQISRIDGVKVSYKDGWVQVRPSNTEPILRVFSEAKEEYTAGKYLDEMLKHIRTIQSRGE